MANIQFHSLVKGLRISEKEILSKWITSAVKSEKKKAGAISIIFCTDAYLLKINQQYLKHDYYTDIITFQYSDNQLVNGDLMISVDRVKENAKEFDCSFKDELRRVIIHGVLHLCGYQDKTKSAKTKMTERENHYLRKLK